jgi:hypothetical protein
MSLLMSPLAWYGSRLPQLAASSSEQFPLDAALRPGPSHWPQATTDGDVLSNFPPRARVACACRECWPPSARNVPRPLARSSVQRAPRAHSKLIGRYGALPPLFRLVGVPCIAAFRRVKSLLCHHSDRPKLANRSAGYFAGATSLTGVSSALVFSPSLLAAFRSRSIRPARRSCTTCVSSSAFFRSS